MTDLSAWEDRAASCPLCGQEFVVRQWRILDIDAHPERIADLHDGTISRDFCPVCIGPGVRRAGALCVVWHEGELVSYASFLPPGTEGADRVRVAVEALEAQLVERAHATGVAPARLSQAATMILTDWPRLGEELSELAPGKGDQVMSPQMGEVFWGLLNCKSTEQRAEYVLAHPELVRPSALRLLASLPDIADRLSMTQIRPLLTFLTHCTRLGLPRAVALDARQDAATDLLRGMSAEAQARFLSFLPREFTADALDGMSLREAEFLATYPGRENACLQALFYENIGGGWVGLADADPERALTAGAPAYEALLALDPDVVPLRSRLDAHLGLSALFDKASAQNHSARARVALKWAEAAKEMMDLLSDEDASRVLSEIGILYTRLLVGDSALNKKRARDALVAARLPGASNGSRFSALHNHALTFVESTTGDIAQDVRIGLSQLDSLRPQLEDFASPTDQRNYHRSRGAAILKLVAHAPEEAPLLTEGLQSVMEAHHLIETTGAVYEEPRLLLMMADMALRQHQAGVPADIDLPGLAGLMQAAEAAAQRFGDVVAQSDAMGLLGRFYDFVDAPVEANRARQAALDLVPETGWWSTVRRLATQIGDSQRAVGDYPAADAAYERAIAATEVLYQQAATASTKDEEIAGTAELYRRWVDCGSRNLVGPDGAMTLAERTEQARARQLLDAMGQSRLDPPASVPAALLDTEAELRATLDSLPEAEGVLASTGSAELRIETLRALDVILDQIASIGPGGAAYVARRRPRPPDRKAISEGMDALPDGSLVLSFYRLPDAWLGLCLGPGIAPRSARIELQPSGLAAVMASFETDILSRPVVDGELPPADHIWCSLGEKLFAPFAREIEEAQRAIVVPHGDLHRLPMAALHLNGLPMVMHLPMQTVPSIGTLLELGRRRQMQSGALVLSAARTEMERTSMDAEARIVADLLGTPPILDATRSDFLVNASRIASIHLCCHGAHRPGDPMNARLRLSDGDLTAGDLAELDMHPRLCVLSACETGQLDIRSGDRLAGFAQVLLESGARSVVLTLWEVFSHSTQEWMTDFYRELVLEGVDLTQAHQRAICAMIERRPDPIHWAPFVLQGAGE